MCEDYQAGGTRGFVAAPSDDMRCMGQLIDRDHPAPLPQGPTIAWVRSLVHKHAACSPAGLHVARQLTPGGLWQQYLQGCNNQLTPDP